MKLYQIYHNMNFGHLHFAKILFRWNRIGSNFIFDYGFTGFIIEIIRGK